MACKMFPSLAPETESSFMAFLAFLVLSQHMHEQSCMFFALHYKSYKKLHYKSLADYIQDAKKRQKHSPGVSNWIYKKNMEERKSSRWYNLK